MQWTAAEQRGPGWFRRFGFQNGALYRKESGSHSPQQLDMGLYKIRGQNTAYDMFAILATDLFWGVLSEYQTFTADLVYEKRAEGAH